VERQSRYEENLSTLNAFNQEHFETYLQAAKLNGNGADSKPTVKDLDNGMVE